MKYLVLAATAMVALSPMAAVAYDPHPGVSHEQKLAEAEGPSTREGANRQVAATTPARHAQMMLASAEGIDARPPDSRT